MCHFLPKFHPETEMNPIEYLCGWAKHYFHEHLNGNFKTVQKIWQDALNNCPLVTIWQFFCQAAHYMSVYRLGATGVLAEYVVKKYCSHHTVQQKDLDITRQNGIRRPSPWLQSHSSRCCSNN